MPDEVYGFRADGIRRIRKAVRLIEKWGPPSLGGDDANNRQNGMGILLQVTSTISNEPGRYNAKSITISGNNNASGGLVLSDIGTVASSETLIAWNAREISHGDSSHGHVINLNDPGQTVNSGRPIGTDQASGKTIVLINADPGVIFRVDLTVNSGGTIGTDTTSSNWQYSAKIPGTSVVLGTNLSPEWGRTNGSYGPAGLGMGYYNASGTFVLLMANELPGTSHC